MIRWRRTRSLLFKISNIIISTRCFCIIPLVARCVAFVRISRVVVNRNEKDENAVCFAKLVNWRIAVHQPDLAIQHSFVAIISPSRSLP